MGLEGEKWKISNSRRISKSSGEKDNGKQARKTSTRDKKESRRGSLGKEGARWHVPQKK